MAPRAVVALGAKALDPEVGAPALEGAGAGLDAAHGGVVVAREEGDIRVADGGVAVGGGAVVGEGGGLVEGFAGGFLS